MTIGSTWFRYKSRTMRDIDYYSVSYNCFKFRILFRQFLLCISLWLYNTILYFTTDFVFQFMFKLVLFGSSLQYIRAAWWINYMYNCLPDLKFSVKTNNDVKYMKYFGFINNPHVVSIVSANKDKLFSHIICT